MVFACLLALAAAGRASAYTQQELSLRMDDGVDLAATLYEPSVAPPPAGHPAIVLFHSLGGKRQDLDFLARAFAGSFAVLTLDARGHGQSGGLVSIDGPREMTDVKAVFNWLAARPEINRNRIGAWGISLGGGAVLRSLVEGVPWAAVETVETWTDLYSALAPQRLTKSGAVFQFLNSVPQARLDPSVLAIRDDALASTNLGAVRAWADARSSRSQLAKVTTPVFMFQGRRDFAFDIAQARAGYRLLKGPKRLYVGDFGHAPSTFPGPDIAQVTSLGLKWFTRYLIGTPASFAPVSLAPSPWRGKLRTYATLPATRRLTIQLGGTDSLTGAGRALRTSGPLTARVETFGSPQVQVAAQLSGGWSRVVAVLTAKPQRGAELVISEGGVNTTGLTGKRQLTIGLIDVATLIPRGSRLQLYLASSSLAQSSGNLLYLNLPMPPSARVKLGPARVVLPILRSPVSR
ncbi:MAG: CocE/NonD family hydrolase [Actinomycetota bacterium]|nr:CocE/NonD family hydrolase [Actinomycetota bacterium]